MGKSPKQTKNTAWVVPYSEERALLHEVNRAIETDRELRLTILREAGILDQDGQKKAILARMIALQ